MAAISWPRRSSSCVVGFFEQAGFHFLQVGAHLGFVQAHHAQGNGLHQADVGLDAVGHAGVLHLHGQRFAVLAGQVYLPDAGRLPRLGLKLIEELVGRLPERIPKGLHHQRAREGRGGVLGLGKLLGVGRGQHVFLHGQHLGHFQHRAFHLAQRAVELGRIGGVQVFGGRLGPHGLFGVVLDVVGAHVEAGFGEARGAGHLGGRQRGLGLVRHLVRLQIIVKERQAERSRGISTASISIVQRSGRDASTSSA